MSVVGRIFPSKINRRARNLCVQSIGQLCVQRDSRTIEKEEIGFSSCTMANMDAEPRWKKVELS